MELKTLFIEDKEDLSRNLQKYFEGEIFSGHAIRAFNVVSFDEGIELIEKGDFDLVILDLFQDTHIKDEEAGLKVLHRVMQNAFIPVIFYTGHAYKISELASEIVGVVNKGDGFDNLKLEIQRIVDSRIALLKNLVYSHLKESLRTYFWDIVHTEKKYFEPIKNDISLGYLLLRRFASSLSKENIKLILGDSKIQVDKTHPMEFYIFPINSTEFEAGEILQKEGVFYTILTPSCDFITEENRPRKVGKVLLAEAIPLKTTELYKKYEGNKEKYKDSVSALIESRKGDRYFFLPGTPFIENLVLDFQNEIIVEYKDLRTFERIAKLDAPYAQSMISNFIRYYNRIGFPDLDCDYILNRL